MLGTSLSELALVAESGVARHWRGTQSVGKKWRRQERPGLEGAGKRGCFRTVPKGKASMERRVARCVGPLNTRLRKAPFVDSWEPPTRLEQGRQQSELDLGRAPWWPEGVRQEAGGAGCSGPAERRPGE